MSINKGIIIIKKLIAILIYLSLLDTLLTLYRKLHFHGSFNAQNATSHISSHFQLYRRTVINIVVVVLLPCNIKPRKMCNLYFTQPHLNETPSTI